MLLQPVLAFVSNAYFCNPQFELKNFLFVDKENRGNRFDGKRVLDARKAQEGPREPRSRDDRNNRRNKPDEENATAAAPAPAGGFGQVLNYFMF